EQGAIHAAQGYARVSGDVGVCFATSGPGATNLVTGIAHAYMDSVPLVAIAGQVPTALLGTDAFQEVDIMGITLPVVKHSFLPRRMEDLPETIREAFRLARSGRPGPVLIDLPKDVAAGEGELEPCENLIEDEPPQPDLAQIQKALELLRNSTKPVIYAGGGIGIGGAVEEFRRFVETTRIPVVATLKGLGALPTDHALFLGMLGMHGTPAANTAVQGADLLICVGARFDDRATGKLSIFAPQAKVIHMDMDRAELGKLRRPDVGLVGDLPAGAVGAIRQQAEVLDYAIELQTYPDLEAIEQAIVDG
ncbi:MAG: acetolactate synthase large subunit, partial [bacterium]|nr:acetolactate synthase large subunit [bacterium]